MSSTDEGNGAPTSYHGIELRPWEQQRLKEGKEKIHTTLNRILATGVRILQRWRQGMEPGEREIGVLKRAKQVLRAANESTFIYLDCSKVLLRALGFDGFPPPSDDNGWLPELEDWDRLF